MRRTRSFTLVLIAIVGVALVVTGYGVAQLTSVETEVRVVARPHEDGRVEFAVQQRVDGEWGERIAPSSRYLTPALIESRAGRWLNSSPITLTVNLEDSSLTQSDPVPDPADGADEGTGSPSATSYEPVIASNFGSGWSREGTVGYDASEDAFTGRVRTDVRMFGPANRLMLDVVCFDNGTAAIGFRLVGFSRPERDASFPSELEVTWRLDAGTVHSETLPVEFLGDTPAVYFDGDRLGFDSSWPQVLKGGMLAVRIGYRGVNEEVFDLDAFAKTPVHLNLVNCGSY